MCSRKSIFQICVSFIHLTIVLTHGRILFHNVKLFNIFKLMQDAGKLYLEKQIADPNVLHATKESKQYLVATVLSEQEIRDSVRWTSLAHISTLGLLKMYINERKNGCNLQIGKKPLHGELKCLYEGGLDTMLETFKGLHTDKMPFVVLYSYYIPCAYVSGIPYSCAEELGKEALANMDNYQMLVGFEELFHRTDDYEAKEFMCRGGIGIYRLKTNEFETLHHIPTGNETNIIFQEKFTRCMSFTGVKKCCHDSVTKKCQHTCFDKKFLKTYADDLSYMCTKENGNMRGKLTELSRGVFAECAKDYVEQNIDPMCTECPFPKTVIYWIRFCVEQSVGSATYIGTQKSQSSWGIPEPNTPWDRLYSGPRPGCIFPRSYCYRYNYEKCNIVLGTSRFEKRRNTNLKNESNNYINSTRRLKS